MQKSINKILLFLQSYFEINIDFAVETHALDLVKGSIVPYIE